MGDLKLDSHNEIVYLDRPSCYITCHISIVLHAEPKYNFDLSLVTTKKFLHVLVLHLWYIHSCHYMMIHHTIFQYTVIYINWLLQTWYMHDNTTHLCHLQPCLTLMNPLMIKVCGISLRALSTLTMWWPFRYWHPKY